MQRWPSVQWSSDEVICGRQTANGVALYSGKDLSAGTIAQINLPVGYAFDVVPYWQA